MQCPLLLRFWLQQKSQHSPLLRLVHIPGSSDLPFYSSCFSCIFPSEYQEQIFPIINCPVKWLNNSVGVGTRGRWSRTHGMSLWRAHPSHADPLHSPGAADEPWWQQPQVKAVATPEQVWVNARRHQHHTHFSSSQGCLPCPPQG